MTASQDIIGRQIIEDECKNVVKQLEDHILELTLEKMSELEETNSATNHFELMLD